MLAFIGFISKEPSSTELSSHDSESESSEFVSEISWKNVPEFTGESILTEVNTIESSFEAICTKAEEMNFERKVY